MAPTAGRLLEGPEGIVERHIIERWAIQDKAELVLMFLLGTWSGGSCYQRSFVYAADEAVIVRDFI
jgi:hypothetical protein